jgi:glycyl-tRNA synthetase
MLAIQKVDPPRQVEIAKLKFDRKLLGRVFKQDQRSVAGVLESLAEDWSDFSPIASALESVGKVTVEGFEITKEMVSWTKQAKTVHEIKFTPSVIEPSFGMGRVLYSLLEHSFYIRENDEQRTVMRFNPQVAPLKCAVLPLSSNPELNAIVDDIAKDLMDNDLATRVDKSSATLGRRYSRADELGVPFAVTVDFITLNDGTVTLRERDSTKQVRLTREELTQLLFKAVHGKVTWEQMVLKYPIFHVEDGEGGEVPNAQNISSPVVIVSSSRGSFHRPASST